MTSLPEDASSVAQVKRKVFGIGLSRTGTTSLTHALTLLGFRTIHLPSDSASKAEIREYLRNNLDSIRLSVLADHDALTDLPVCGIYKGLDRAYPDSKFILTIRDKKSWLESFERLWRQIIGPFFAENLGTAEVNYYASLWSQLIGPTVDGFDPSEYDPHVASEMFDVYHENVRNYFKGKEERLLVLNIVAGEGWEKLAPFLDLPVPSVSFPFEMRLRKRTGPEELGKSDTGSTTQSEAVVNTVSAYLASFRDRDLESCMDFFADDAVLKFIDQRFAGHEAIADWHHQRFRAKAALVDVGPIEAMDDFAAFNLTVASNVLKRWRIKARGRAIVRIDNDKFKEVGFEGIRLVRR